MLVITVQFENEPLNIYEERCVMIDNEDATDEEIQTAIIEEGDLIAEEYCEEDEDWEYLCATHFTILKKEVWYD